MKVELNREALESLVKGSQLSYHSFGNELVEKAGHSYSDCYGKTSWDSLNKLTEEEVYKLYEICINSWS